jgi:dolichol-phosphate mannosyltransferase
MVASSAVSAALATAQSRNELPRQFSKTVVVLPAYNEEADLGRLLKSIDEAMTEAFLPYAVIVVDDGSRDRTSEIVQQYAGKMPLTLTVHEVNQGLGATIRDGVFLAATVASEKDIIITMDADDTHCPGLILRMVRMIREGHDVVIASRYQPGARVFGLSFHRRLLSLGASLLFRIFFPTQGIRDFTSGYRAYRASVLKKALARYGQQFIEADGFQCMVDILLKLRNLEIVFGEVPMLLRYDLKQGQSKMHVSRTIRNTLSLLVKRRLGF